VTKWPPGQDYPPSQESFAPLTPNIRLFLSMNSLRSLPVETFNVERLTFLSLRRNKLQSLPPAISRLVNLEELNVAGNRLNYLPWELLKLVRGKLKRLLLYPNPFIEADVSFPQAKNDDEQGQLDAGFFPGGFDFIDSDGPKDGSGPTPRRKWKPLCLGKGSIAYLSSTGQPIRDSIGAFVPSCMSPIMAQPEPKNETKPINFSSATRVPSLTELALLRCSESSNLNQLSNYLPSDTSVEVLQLLETAKKVKDEGEKVCSVCGRKFVVARSEWIEWWDCIPPSDPERPPRRRIDTLPIPPLLRQGCSWLCTGERTG
jgi:Leucine-rich repeat (LRR) protein